MFPTPLWLQANMTRLITLSGIRRSACTLIRPRKGWSGSSTWMVSYRRFSSRSASSSSGTLIARPFTRSPVLSSILPSKVTASGEMEITGARSSCEPWYASGNRMSLLMYSTSPFALKFISRKMTMIVITSTSEVSVSAAYTPRLPRMNFFPSTLLRAIRSQGRLPGVTMAIPIPSVRRRNRDVAQLLAHRHVHRLLSAPAGVFLRCCASHDRPPSASPGERLLLGQIRRDPHLVLVGDDQVEHAHRGLVDVVDHVLGAALQEREGDQGGDGDDQS